ncbi:ABC transporter substrate-binding protein [Bacillaceae bacterium IKA-2]|nr:ABC transporter substrate-binding protein [Bacillaceae bacterium IKA-2]
MKRKNFILLFSVILSLLLFMTACSSNDEPEDTAKNDNSQNNVEENEGSLSEQVDSNVITGIRSSILTLDPANHRDRTTESVLRNLYDGLVMLGVDGEIIPKIAESWENTTPTEWIFNIREGVKFHDGSDLTAHDVKFTFDRIIKEGAMAGETSPRLGLMGPVEGVELVDDYTVKFLLAEPWPILLKMIPHQQILPQAYIEEVGDPEWRENPIGAGPYKFVSAELDERIVFERFDDYYEGAPSIKNLVFDVIPEVSSRIAALQAGEVQRITGISPDLVSVLENDANIEVKVSEGTRVTMMEMNTLEPPFDDVRVRQAMNHAINMDLVIDAILGGYASRTNGALLHSSFGINEDLQPYEYNPEKAKQLLAEAGYEDGFQVVIDTHETFRDIAEAVAPQLREIGIDASSRIWDAGVIRPMLLNGERIMSIDDWGASALDPFGFLDAKLVTDARGNFSQYSNDRVDELLNAGMSEDDVTKREEIYYEAQEIIYVEAPWVFSFVMQELEAGVKQLGNWAPSPDGMLYMPHATMSE